MNITGNRRLLMSALLRLASVFLAVAAIGSAQQPETQVMRMQHEHQETTEVRGIEFPRLGRAQTKAGTANLFTLDRALETALRHNPTLRQADAGVRAARARAQQEGLYPNPTVGYSGDEIRGGESGGGKQGFFIEQTIVTGGKLSRAREVLRRKTQLAEIEAEEQKIRVETAVRISFYRVLAAQELADARTDLARVAQESLATERRLQNTGQADETETLAAELEVRRMKLSARTMENTLREQWRALASVLGQPELALQTVGGDLEHGWPELEENQVETVAAKSPATRIASSAKERANAQLARAQREKLPDILLRAGADYNHEPLENPLLTTGWQWNAQVAVELPVFNRNQGNIAAARSDIERAEAEKQRVALTLLERASAAFDEYANARLTAEEYRDAILPLAKKSYELMFDRYTEMLASFPRLIETKRKLFELQAEYITTLETVWTTGLSLQGFLLTDGLEAPAQPDEMDRAIREMNLPTPERISLP
jgi:cobalt-zinc-cadmium efflux system outer membrane protein